MEVKNYYDYPEENQRTNNKLLPDDIRGIITGKSGGGKTVLILNLLLEPDWLDYEKMMFFGMSLHQRKYRIVEEGFKRGLSKREVSEIFKNKELIEKNGISVFDVINKMSSQGHIECSFYEDADKNPDPRELNKQTKNLIIFDDLMTEKQNTCVKYYTRGRHNNVNCFYLAQDYYELPKRTIRRNANFIIFFETEGRSMNIFYNDHVSSDMPKEEF